VKVMLPRIRKEGDLGGKKGEGGWAKGGQEGGRILKETRERGLAGQGEGGEKLMHPFKRDEGLYIRDAERKKSKKGKDLQIRRVKGFQRVETKVNQRRERGEGEVRRHPAKKSPFSLGTSKGTKEKRKCSENCLGPTREERARAEKKF